MPRMKATRVGAEQRDQRRRPGADQRRMAEATSFDRDQTPAALNVHSAPMHYPASELVIDPVLLRNYDVSGPRYTSYPTADRFVEAFGEAQLRQWLGKRNIGGISQPLSVYVHLPFCDTLCYYCACNKVVTRDHAKSAKYISYLERELALVEPLLGRRSPHRRSCTGAAARRPSSRTRRWRG